MNHTEVDQLLSAHQDACMRMIGDVPYWTVLVTAETSRIVQWLQDLFLSVRPLDDRGDTARIQVIAESVDPKAAMWRAVQAAVKHDVTLQLLCCYEPIAGSEEEHDLGVANVVISELREEYPVVHLSSSRKGWKL